MSRSSHSPSARRAARRPRLDHSREGGAGSGSVRAAERPPLPVPELVALCLEDPASPTWTELVTRYRRRVDHGVRKALRRFELRPDPVRVEDLVQETWCRVIEDRCRRLRGFRGTAEGQLGAWLVRLAERTAIDALRSAAAAKRGVDRLVPQDSVDLEGRSDPTACPAHRAELQERLGHLGRRVLALNGNPRNAPLLRLVLAGGWTSSELAAASGGRITPSRVDSLVHRIRRRLEDEGWSVHSTGRIAA